MKTGEWRKWLAAGTGVGIEIRGDRLEAMLVRVRPWGVQVAGMLSIERFRERPAADWGAEYASFLREHGASHLAAVVLLPRHELTVRYVSLPGVSSKDLPAAVEFQLDELHPYGEEEALHGWARTLDGTGVLIGIARAELIHRYAAWFAEAGIRVAAFTFSAAVLHAATRLLTQPPEGGFLALEEGPAGLEAYGESAARPVFSAVFDLAPERAAALVQAELRLNEEGAVRRLWELLPAPAAVPEGVELGGRALLYATAMAAACPWLAVKANLLPEHQRASSSRAVYIPTLALAVLLVGALAALVAYGRIEDRRYLAALEQEIARWTPQAAEVRELEAKLEELRARRQEIYQFRLRSRADLDALLELTRLLEPPTWLASLQLSRTAVQLAGETTRGPELLRLLDRSPLFGASQFTTPMTRVAGGESFAIRAEREALVLERTP